MSDYSTRYYGSERTEMIQFVPETAKKILDIGCSIGLFGEKLISPNREIWGIEPDEKAASFAQKKYYKVLLGNIEEKANELPDNYFEVISLNDVLEHLIDPWAVLEMLKPKLSLDGVIICSIPNVRYIGNLKHLIIDKDWEYESVGIRDLTHLRFFTRKSIIKMFEKGNWKIFKVQGINQTASKKLLLCSRIINLFTFNKNFDIKFWQFAIVVSKKS